MADEQFPGKPNRLQKIPRENPNIYKESSRVLFSKMFATLMMITVTNDSKKSYSDDNDKKSQQDLSVSNHNYTFLNSFIVHVIAYM